MSFGMYSKEGNEQLEDLLQVVLGLDPEDRDDHLGEGLTDISVDHPEVFDAAARQAIKKFFIEHDPGYTPSENVLKGPYAFEDDEDDSEDDDSDDSGEFGFGGDWWR